MNARVPAEAPLDCPLCPRLVAFREDTARAHPDWHNAPVESFGPGTARLLVVGLAPGLRGANRTGRPFTGDWAGDLLYATLGKFGFTRGTYDGRPDDGLELVDAMITNAVRCVPPENKPVGAEANACRPYLTARIAALPRLKAILCLGKISHDNTLRALGHRMKDAAFGHGATAPLRGPNGPVRLFDSYHCSRYNTNTGRLTEAMFETVFADIRTYLDAG
ncbi:uracil-DNA glycosylase [Maricaulis sp.]|uniref:uracil-DNA glycosylase n=1 Tax=Maricaulis sp. TaxID=1486257 RepID=UPI0026029C62|nr:uracil-DNA glycosylase [Maricaulis sp.]